MSAKVLARNAAQASQRVQFPTLPHPQYVDEDGYEVDEPVGEGVPENALDGEELLGGQLESEGKAPLLSVADSLVLSYSLAYSRNSHTQNLLPHIFTHPPIPSHNKPRARPLPRTTFLFPTPPPPLPPLPANEYHGPLAPRPPAPTPTSAAPAASLSTNPLQPAPIPSSPVASTSKPPKSSKKAVEPPAHEIECIARVTLTIGPVSYPGTELWIGKFVEPRVIYKREKGKRAERRPDMAVKRNYTPSHYSSSSTNLPPPAQRNPA
ncbi:hypothetical protein P7C73_g3890, partial [Tremellales sp. Uapishka_1]